MKKEEYIKLYISQLQRKLEEKEPNKLEDELIMFFCYSLFECSKKMNYLNMDFGIENVIPILEGDKITYIVATRRPGLIIGKGGCFIDSLTKSISRRINNLESNIEENERQIKIDLVEINEKFSFDEVLHKWFMIYSDGFYGW